MRRTIAWALGAMALGCVTSGASAQSYGYAQYPQYPGYGAAPAPGYRVMPAPVYTMPAQYYSPPRGGYYTVPAPSYQPGAPTVVTQPNYVISPPFSVVNTPQGTTQRSGEPITLSPGSSKPAAASIARALPSGPATNPPQVDHGIPTTTTTIVDAPPGTPTYAPGMVTEEYNNWAPTHRTPAEKFNREPEPGCRVMFGGGAMYVRPHYASNSAITVVSPQGPLTGAAITTSEFDQEWEAAPYGWIAWINKEGRGVRTRFWSLRQDQSALSVSSPAGSTAFITGLNLASPSLASPLLNASDTLSASNSLDMHVLDLERVWQANEGPWTFLIAAGARYADLEQTRTGQIVTPIGIAAASNATHEFRAIGPTLALEATGGLSRHFAVYVNGRVSVLYGTHDLEQVEENAGVLAQRSTAGNESGRDVVPVLELEAGIQAAFHIGHHNLLVFRGGFMAQNWIDAGSSVSRSGNLDLVGGMFQVGFAY